MGGDGLRQSYEKVHPFPSWTEYINFLKTACHSHLFSNSLTFKVLSKFPWPSKKFPNFSLTWKKFNFPDIFPDHGNLALILYSFVTLWPIFHNPGMSPPTTCHWFVSYIAQNKFLTLAILHILCWGQAPKRHAPLSSDISYNRSYAIIH